MKTMIFAANWKMHHGPESARDFMQVFLGEHREVAGVEVWFFPPAVALTAVTDLISARPELRAGAQNVHWEPKGAFTGEFSVSMVKEAGGRAALVGHSERRHVFGETDLQTGKKVRAVLDAGLTPVLCVGETIEQREAGETFAVVERQLGVLEGLDVAGRRQVVIAYEPVWAIGTGKNATPQDAAAVHQRIRSWLSSRGVETADSRILYGGSVNPNNAASLVGEEEIDGVLVGGASLDPVKWASITRAGQID
jgi:triosephosphate isomerase